MDNLRSRRHEAQAQLAEEYLAVSARLTGTQS